jgi:hypothetical protein
MAFHSSREIHYGDNIRLSQQLANFLTFPSARSDEILAVAATTPLASFVGTP